MMRPSSNRTGSFNTLIQGVLEDSQPFIHQHQPSIIKKILSIGRFRLPKTLAQAPFPPLPSAQYRRKDVSATTGDDSPPTGTDITHFEFSGQAAGWGETIPIPPPLGECNPTNGRSSAEDYLQLGVKHIVQLDLISLLAVSSASPPQ